MSATHPGQKLRALRKSKGLNQNDIAAKVGVTQQTVAKWEKGPGEPKPKQRKALAEHFGFHWLEESANLMVDRRQQTLLDSRTMSKVMPLQGTAVGKAEPDHPEFDTKSTIASRVYAELEQRYRAYMRGRKAPVFYESDTLYIVFTGVSKVRPPNPLLTDAHLYRLAIKAKIDPAKRAYLMQVSTDGSSGVQLSMARNTPKGIRYAPLFGVTVFAGSPDECAEMVMGLEDNSDYDLKGVYRGEGEDTWLEEELDSHLFYDEDFEETPDKEESE